MSATDVYHEENASVGLTTLTSRNLIVSGGVTTLSFTGKSGKRQDIAFADDRMSRIIAQLRQRDSNWLFTYDQDGSAVKLEPKDINHYLRQASGKPISAKDFRTWGGTLLAFSHLSQVGHRPGELDKKQQAKEVIAAVDTAANILGNTRAVARSSYVHPSVLKAFGTRDFSTYLARANRRKPIPGLGQQESRLTYFLQQLLDGEFGLLKQPQATVQPAGHAQSRSAG